MRVCVSGYDPAKTDAIRAAASDEWPFDDWWQSATSEIIPGLRWQTEMETVADGNLGSKETERAFAQSLSKAIWLANGDYCRVSVEATSLDHAPFTEYAFDEEVYEQLMADRAKDSDPEVGPHA
jgi:hypothetical protein